MYVPKKAKPLAVFCNFVNFYFFPDPNPPAMYFQGPQAVPATLRRAPRDDAAMREVTLADVLFRSYKNDVAFEFGDRIVVFVEHQSTPCPNIAARMLAYMNETYRSLLDPETMDSTIRMRLPRPEFYVLYNGRADLPAHQRLYLSDLYVDGAKKNTPTLDLAVDIYNIN